MNKYLFLDKVKSFGIVTGPGCPAGIPVALSSLFSDEFFTL